MGIRDLPQRVYRISMAIIGILIVILLTVVPFWYYAMVDIQYIVDDESFPEWEEDTMYFAKCNFTEQNNCQWIICEYSEEEFPDIEEYSGPYSLDVISNLKMPDELFEKTVMIGDNNYLFHGTINKEQASFSIEDWRIFTPIKRKLSNAFKNVLYPDHGIMKWELK